MRKSYLSFIALASFAVLVLLVPQVRAATKYTIGDLGTLGGSESFPYAINDRGQVVGLSRLAGDGSSHAFLYTKGAIADLAPLNSGGVVTAGPSGINNGSTIASGVMADGIYYPAVMDGKTGEITILGSFGGLLAGGFSGVATAINGDGHAVGVSYLDDLNRHAFVYRDGVMTDIGSFGGYSHASDINDVGVIVGFSSELVNGYPHAFIYRDGRMVEIDAFGGPHNESDASALNNLGEVVGTARTTAGDAFHGFRYWHGTVTDLGTLAGGRNSYAYGINERGQVVGMADYPYAATCWDSDAYQDVPCTMYVQAAFLYENGEMKNLNSLIAPDSGWTLETAVDINSRGQIIGWGLYNGHYRGYLLTPHRSAGGRR